MKQESANPYAPPLSIPVEEVPEVVELPLASRTARFGAAVIDSVIIGVIGSLFIQRLPFLLGVFSPLGSDAVLFGGTLLAILVVHGGLLHIRGQTIGKAVLKIKIVTMAGKKPCLADLVLRRYGFTTLLPYIPIVGSYLPLLDILFILRKDQRCLHDWVAGTKVVDTTPGAAASAYERFARQPSVDSGALKLSSAIRNHLQINPKQISLSDRWIDDLKIAPSDLRAFFETVARDFPGKDVRELESATSFGALLIQLGIHRQSILQIPRSVTEAANSPSVS